MIFLSTVEVSFILLSSFWSSKELFIKRLCEKFSSVYQKSALLSIYNAF